jgi:hypothetical protein
MVYIRVAAPLHLEFTELAPATGGQLGLRQLKWRQFTQKESTNMDMKDIAKQTIGFNKAAFNNGFAAMMLAQEQMGILATNIMSQVSGFPTEGKEAIGDWTRAYKQGCDLFIKAVNDAFENAEDLIDLN